MENNLSKIIQRPQDELLDEKEAAALLDLKPGTLAVFRSTGRHSIPFLKIGRNVRYRRSDLDAWLQRCTRADGSTG